MILSKLNTYQGTQPDTSENMNKLFLKTVT